LIFKWTPLHLACEFAGRCQDKAMIVRVLLELPNLDVNAQNDDGDTALHKACTAGGFGYIEVVQALLQCDLVDVNRQNRKGVCSDT